MDIVGELNAFLKPVFNRTLVVALLLLGALLLLAPAPISTAPASAPNATSNLTDNSTGANLTIHFFFLPTCPHCAEQKPINQKLAGEFPRAIFVYHDVTNPKESELLIQMLKEQGADTSRVGVPTTIIGKQVFVGFDSTQTEAKLRSAIRGCLDKCVESPPEVANQAQPAIPVVDIPLLGRIDLKSMSLPVLAALLGFVDGINPCAMWVLVYLISLLANLNDRRRMWLIIGIFLLSSGILYYLFMTAWLNAFLLLGYIRAITIAVGLFALGSGILSIKEFIDSGGQVTCKVGGADDKKKTMSQMQALVASPLTVATFVGIVMLAFAINSVEFVCSSAIPAVFTQVLAVSNLSVIEYYGYMALYVFFFMLDDLIVFGLAAFALSTDLGQQYAGYCKIIGGAIMTILGALLLFAPQLLR